MPHSQRNDAFHLTELKSGDEQLNRLLLNWNKPRRLLNHPKILLLFTLIFSVLMIFYYITSTKLTTNLDPIDFSSSQTIPAFVITLAGYDERVPELINLFRKYANIDPEPFYGVNGHKLFGHLKHIEGKYGALRYSGMKNKPLMTGERGLRETMRQVFTLAYKRNYERVIILEDDSIPHYNFTTLFKGLHARCQQADVLLLGATIWHSTIAHWPHGICFDADSRTFGAFALLVKRPAILSILSWLEKGGRIPFDHMYTHLQSDGIVVRVAHPPFLVVPDVGHNSSINNNRGAAQFDVQKRARKHDWHLQNYPSFTSS